MADYNLYIALAGFSVSFVLFFHLMDRYKACARKPKVEQRLIKPLPAKPFPPRAPIYMSQMPKPPLPPKIPPPDSINRQIEQFRERIKQMQFIIEEKKPLQEKQISEIILNINTIVGKLDSVEPAYAEKIHTALATVVSELERLRAPASPDAAKHKRSVFN